jgi:hypothetical protein
VLGEDTHDRGVGVQGLLHVGGLCVTPPLVGDHRRLDAVDLRDRLETVGEVARVEDQDLVAGRTEVHDGRLHP